MKTSNKTSSLDEKIEWRHRKALYGDWKTIRMIWMFFAAVFGGLGLIMLLATKFENGWSFLLLFAKLILFMEVLATFAYWLWAWANDGEEVWGYVMNSARVVADMIQRHPERLNKLLFMSPRGARYDSREKHFQVWLCEVVKVDELREKGDIRLETRNNAKTLHVPPERYDEVLAFIKENIPHERPKRRRKKKQTPETA